MTTSLGNLRISTRLTVAFSALTVLMVIITASAYRGMSDMDRSSTEIATNWMPSVEVLGRMSRNVTAIRLAELQTVIAADSGASSVFEREMETALKRFATDHEAYVAMVDPGAETRLNDAFSAAWKHYVDAHARALALSHKGDRDGARAAFEGGSRQAFDEVEATLDALIEFNHAGGIEAAHLGDTTYSQARMLLLGTSLVSLLLAIVTNLSLVRSITRPLQRAVAVADRVASGDLSSTIDVTSQDETGQLLASLGRMQQSLSRTVGSVRTNAESVASTSAQIAQGNADLSQRTEEQASSLQQAAASMEQLGTTVKQNAGSASQANGLALDASTVASKGGQVVAEVVATMRGIDQSSKRIADIIGVIDGIAFQTNILALNAAVEAARAGEQGRGFAVVASEVRSLAQRSAEAAKEIKTLIANSVEQVERGTTLVDRAGATMDDIVGSIGRVADIVSEISAASAEQSSSVDEISRAVSQMDRVTQQNAALVEESAAAADGLKGQAELLVGAVATFKLN